MIGDEPAQVGDDEDLDPSFYSVFAAEYAWLRSFGKSDAAIARHFGCSEEGLRGRLVRAGLRSAALSPDPDIDSTLQNLIAAGEPFDSWTFPLAVDPSRVKAAISLAVRRGLLERIGDRKGQWGARRGIYRRSRPADTAGGGTSIQVVA
ncbi:hypothetical protein [Mycobacteroides abscessus]|uniref:hypothetical protein n=1 Tax=Mycobacteroides abscessus TaxID=36809 RepID=UPI000C256979|nr:hypothetical protein [Mycobacteroides abscessus]